jgi:hypothetical protein
MAHIATAETVFQELQHMPALERERFFTILSTNAFRDDNLSHEQLFGQLSND